MYAQSTVILGNPHNRRVALFQGALASLGRPPARVVSYFDVLNGRSNLAEVIPAGAVVRIESPGEDFEVERLLLRAGHDAAATEDSPSIAPAELRRLSFDPGLILYPRQWYLGYCATLRLIAEQLSAAAPHQLLSSPAEIELLFDKPRCQKRLATARVPVPDFWNVPKCYDQVRDQMRTIGCRRAFVKLAHSSSGSGVVALYVGQHGVRAVTPAEIVRNGGEFRLYNSLKIRCYTNETDVADLIDELCRHRVQFERWLPKATLENATFDLRVLVIAGHPRHVVVRTSRTPLTNLHLGNRRGSLESLVAKAGPRRWEAALEVCRHAAAEFACCWHVGIDLLLQPGFRCPTVLEANAFGDLLPGAKHKGEDTYTAELAALCGAESIPATLMANQRVAMA
jgi:hypothetical protein